MTNKEFIYNYHTHEAILHKCMFDEENKTLTFVIRYCEWQLEEMGNNSVGYVLTLKNVKDVSSFEILNCHNEFILDAKLNKTKGMIYLDCDICIKFSYKNFEVVDLFKWKYD